MKPKSLLALGLVSLAAPSFALPAYDPFADATGSGGTAYTTGSPLIGQTNAQGLGWTQAGPNPITVQSTISAGSLSVSGLPTSSGNSVQFGGNGTSARFNFGASATSGTIYYSFAVQLTDITAMSASGVFWAGFNNSVGSQTTTPTTVGTRIVTRSSGTGYQIGLDKSSGSAANFVFDPNTYNVGDTLFLVASYTFNSGTTTDDVSRLWVNPSSATFGGPDPSGAISVSAGNDLATIASFVLFNRNAGEPASGLLDELRIGTSYADVTAVPEPGSALLVLAGVAALCGRRLARR